MNILLTELENFLKAYEVASNSHDFAKVAPLINSNAVYWFSDGTHVGKEAIQKAFEAAWNWLPDEVYTITDVQWIAVSASVASCIYTFHWKGTIDGKVKEGRGRGTNVLQKNKDTWEIVHEHLSKSI